MLLHCKTVSLDHVNFVRILFHMTLATVYDPNLFFRFWLHEYDYFAFARPAILQGPQVLQKDMYNV